MKKLMSVILLLSIVSPAAFAKLESVSVDAMLIYHEVLKTQNLSCQDEIGKIVLYGDEVKRNLDFKVDKTGGQPAFFMSTESYQTRHVLSLYTSADQQRVIKGHGEDFKSVIVNRGTLVAPRYVEEWVSTGKYNCAPLGSK